jgi:Fe/S biogenesis protein NfuA
MAQTTNAPITETIVSITDEAVAVVNDAISQEPNASELALWLEVRGVDGGKFAYDLYFQATADAADDDASYDISGVTVVVPSDSIERLRGARLEFSEEGGGGLVMVNPNVPTPAEIAPGVPEEILALGLEGPLAVRAIAVLEADVNPSIASHGGRADLVAIDEDKGIAYLALSGGCQGCAMSRQTLSNGIEVMLKEQIPQLTDIIDVTDHAVGENPFYAN